MSADKISEAMVKPLEWIDHQEDDGCPVSTSAFVDVRYRDGDFSMCVAAGGLPWSKTGTYCDIVAFRVVPPPNVRSAAADDIKAAYFEGFLAGCDQGEQTGKRYAEKNWPFSQAQSDHERVLMVASAIDADLVAALRSGVPIAGESSDGTDLYDIDAAETTMALAADALTAALSVPTPGAGGAEPVTTCQHNREWLETFSQVVEGRLEDELAGALGVVSTELAPYSFAELLEIVRERSSTPVGEMVLVPREPTPEMMAKAFDAVEINNSPGFATGDQARRAIWQAMLAASPQGGR